MKILNYLKVSNILFLTIFSFGLIGSVSSQSVTASNVQRFSNITVSDCGAGIWKVTAYQNYQWQVGRIQVKYGGSTLWSLGYTAGSNIRYRDCCSRPLERSGTLNTWWYAEVNTNTNRVDFYTSDWTCSPPSEPSIDSKDITDITVGSATCGGESIDDNGSSITSKGVCWNTTGSPTISDSKTDDGSGTGDYTSSITGLSSGTTYYLKSYATNGIGTTYGLEKSFTTSEPLPVELLYFESIEKEDYVLLNWGTASEINNDYFIIEKSNDGKFWVEISNVYGSGSSTNKISYSYLDKEFCGKCYYKLSQVDYDGTKEEFKIISVNSDKDKKLSINIIPNKIMDKTNVSFITPKSGYFNFIIVSQNGQVVYESKLIGVEGRNSFTLNTDILSKGIYSFIINDVHGNMVQQRIVK
jgi:hypothetical protein